MRTNEFRFPLVCAAVAFAACTACAPQERAEDDAADAAPPPADAPPVEEPPLPTAPEPRAESRLDTVMLEGMPEPVTLHLYESPPESPVPFTVYLPAAFHAEAVPADGGTAIRFAADFANTGEAPGWVEVLFHPLDTSESEARESLQRAAASGARRPRSTEGTQFFSWAIDEQRFLEEPADGSTVFGTVALGRYGERLFQVTMRYPAEWADGFGPRSALMLQSWRWASGESLDSETAATR